MIHLVVGESFGRYAAVMDAMFRMRHEIYVGERGWHALAKVDARERDQFDDERAVYFLALDEAGAPIVSARMRPTDDASLLQSLFPNLIAPGERAEFGADVWELTRWFVAPAWRGPRSRRHRDEIKVAMLEAAMARGIRHINLVADTFFLPGLRSAGWRFRHLGLPAAYDEGEAMAVEIFCRPEDVQRMREFGAIQTPVLFDISKFPLHPSVDPVLAGRFLDALNKSVVDERWLDWAVERERALASGGSAAQSGLLIHGAAGED